MTAAKTGKIHQPSLHRLSAQEVEELHAWLNTARFVVTAAVALFITALWRFKAIDFDPRPILLGLLPLEILLALCWEFLRRRVRSLNGWLALPLIADVVIITVGVYFTGSIHTPFIFVYLLVIVSAATISFWTTAGIGFLTLALYSALIMLDDLRLLPAMGAAPRGLQPGDIVNIGIFFLMIVLLAFLSYFYISRIRERDEQVLKIKDEFLFRTIHDLRSPSTAIRFTLDKLKEQGVAEKYPGLVKDIELVRNAITRMATLIEDLLKIASGARVEIEFKKDELNLENLVETVLEELRPLIESKKLTVSYNKHAVSLVVIGESEKLKEVFSNILNNAVKYNKESGKISVSYRQQGRFAVADITDTGIGIAPENLDKIFMPFFRGDVDRTIEGTGLGLYYTKKLVEKMGGKITVESSFGNGSVFSVFLPGVSKS